MGVKEEIGRRLRQFGASKFKTMSAFAAAVGMTPQDLNRYLSGRAMPGNKVQARLRDLGCDLTFLMTGRSESGAHEPAARYGFGEVQYPLVSHIWAGKGGTEKAYEFDSKLKMDGPSDPSHRGSLYFSVHGDSMEPKWEEGDFVLVNPAIKPKNGGYGVVCWDDETGALKKVFYQKTRLLLQSLNAKHEAIVVDKEAVWFIGKVVSTLHK